MKKPKTTKHFHGVVLQEGGSTVTKTVQLLLKQSGGSNARINYHGPSLVNVSQRDGHFPGSS